jgi:hypothetical protein
MHRRRERLVNRLHVAGLKLSRLPAELKCCGSVWRTSTATLRGGSSTNSTSTPRPALLG